MNKKLLTAAIENEYILSLYTYAMSEVRDGIIVLVEQFDASAAEVLQNVIQQDEQVIVLLRDDLECGDDVYSIPLLHMQWKSVCEWGDDLLSTLTIPEDGLRAHLEGMVRHVMIDLREAITRQSPDEEVRAWLFSQYDRLLCACAAYAGWEGPYESDAMATYVDEKRSVGLGAIGELLRKKALPSGWKMRIHDWLADIVVVVDTM